MLEIQPLQVGPLQTNCYLVYCSNTKHGVVIDPGWSGKKIYDRVKELEIDVKSILVTHTHFDHVGGAAELVKLSHAPLLLHPLSKDIVGDAHLHARYFGLEIDPVPVPDSFIDEGQIIPVGNGQLEVIYTPGHAPEHICFYARSENIIFDGDVMFNGGIGRTDLPGGDYDQLINSIQKKLMVLPDDTIVYPGHGPVTKIGLERQINPYL